MSWNESSAAQSNPLIAVPRHDELVEQLFVRDLKRIKARAAELAR